MEKYRIESIEKVRLNGKDIKIFKVFELNEALGAYIFIGQFTAPAKTANKKLINFIHHSQDL